MLPRGKRAALWLWVPEGGEGGEYGMLSCRRWAVLWWWVCGVMGCPRDVLSRSRVGS